MKIASLDRSMSLSVAAPGCGFALTLDGHAWLFDKDGEIRGSIIPVETTSHVALSRIERCPICVAFIER